MVKNLNTCLVYLALLGIIAALDTSKRLSEVKSLIGNGDPLEEKLDAINQARRYLSKVRQPIKEIIAQVQAEEVARIEASWTGKSYKEEDDPPIPF